MSGILHEIWNNFNDFCVTKYIACSGAVSVDLKQKPGKSESWLKGKPSLLQIFFRKKSDAEVASCAQHRSDGAGGQRLEGAWARSPGARGQLPPRPAPGLGKRAASGTDRALAANPAAFAGLERAQGLGPAVAFVSPPEHWPRSVTL